MDIMGSGALPQLAKRRVVTGVVLSSNYPALQTLLKPPPLIRLLIEKKDAQAASARAVRA